MLKDIHTHRSAPQPEAVISLSLTPQNAAGLKLDENQAYSIGIHPWDTASYDDSLRVALEKFSELDNVVAIGECGLDKTKDAPWFKQLLIFRMQVEISEKAGKPLIIHDVKAHDVIVGLRRDLQPAQPWIIHGFRGKPAVAEMLLRAGCHLSFGEKFNEDTVKTVPADRLFAETDESPLSIDEIIDRLSAARGEPLAPAIENNIKSILPG